MGTKVFRTTKTSKTAKNSNVFFEVFVVLHSNFVFFWHNLLLIRSKSFVRLVLAKS
jgi:hypothetical protein